MQAALRFCMITTVLPAVQLRRRRRFVQRLSNELARRGHLVEVIHCTDAYRSGRSSREGPYRDHPGVRVHGLKSAWGRLSPLLTQQTGFPLLKGKRIRRILERASTSSTTTTSRWWAGPAC